MTILVAARGLGLAVVPAGLAAGHTLIASERSETEALHEPSARHGDRLLVVRFQHRPYPHPALTDWQLR